MQPREAIDAVDHHTPEGVEILRQLAARSDVFRQNFRSSVRDKLAELRDRAVVA